MESGLHRLRKVGRPIDPCIFWATIGKSRIECLGVTR
jgi:hypothetical protein